MNYLKKYKIFIGLFFLLLFTFILFSNSFHNQYVGDDQLNVIDNKFIRSLNLNNIEGIFLNPFADRYTPLSILTFAFTYKFFGLNPAPYHITNVILHLLNILLVFWLIFLISKNAFVSFFTAAGFAIHPHVVEAVVWISTRSSLLYSLFFLLALIFYVYFLKSKKNIFYAASFCFFFLSCFSKPSAIIFPLVLFLVDYLYKRKLNFKLLIEKIPFLILSGVFTIITFMFKGTFVFNEYITYSFLDRIYLTSFALVSYIFRFFYPLQTLPFNNFPIPNDQGNLPLIYPFASLVLVVLLSLFLLIKEKFNLKPKYLFGLLFFLITISLNLEIIPSGNPDFIGERYTYIPYIGLFYLLGYCFFFILKKRGAVRFAAFALLVLYFCFFSYRVYSANSIWKDNYTFWTYSEKTDPNNYSSYVGLSYIYRDKGDYKTSLLYLDKAIFIVPKFAMLYNERGIIKRRLGDIKGAYDDYSYALTLRDRYVNAYYNRGILESSIPEAYPQALSDFNSAILINKKLAIAYDS